MIPQGSAARLRGLIARLEAATGPDRELDIAIWHYLGNPKERTPLLWVGCYTSSIDAALTLVPEGHDWSIGDVNGHFGGTPVAYVGNDTARFGETPALSLCIAALKARLATQDASFPSAGLRIERGLRLSLTLRRGKD